MTHQYRPRREAPERRSPMYCPERDLAHVGVGMIRAGAIATDSQYWEPWYREYITNAGLNEDAIHSGLTALAKMTELIITTRDPQVAAREVGFDQLPPVLQVAIYARLGQVLLLGVWSGVRDVKAMNSPTPPEVLELVATIEDIVTSSAVARAERSNRSWWHKLAVRGLSWLLQYLD